MRALLTIVLIAAAGTALAADRAPRIKRGTPYLAETVRLTNAGWKPVTLDRAEGCRTDDGRCRSRPEVRWCAPAAFGECGFTWTRNGRLVEVVTLGSDPPRVQRTRCLVGNGCR